MTIAIVIVLAAIVSLVLIVGMTVSRSLQVSRRGQLAPGIQPIDVDAFRNLVDPAQTQYLRQRLSGSAFRSVQRARLRAMAAYIRQAGRNAVVLVEIGQAAMSAGDPRTLQAAQELVNQALLVRRNALFALIKIHVELTLPMAATPAPRVFSGYEQMSRTAMLLGRLQNPVVPVRLSGHS